MVESSVWSVISVIGRPCSRAQFVSGLLIAIVAVSAGANDAPRQAAVPSSLPTGGHADNRFIPAWDGDGDGRVARSEYEALRKERFEQTDSNADGALNVDEYLSEYAVRLNREITAERKASTEQTDTRFRVIDRDKNGRITAAEFAASGERTFAALDHDKDGRIAHSDPAGRDGDSPRPGQSALRMPSTHNRDGLLDLFDEDGDRLVTRSQYDAQRKLQFTHTDANRDGSVERSEYVGEFERRLDRHIEDTQQSQAKQARVRFKSIDDNEDGRIDHEEYSRMSTRMFERADSNRDGVVNQADPPTPRERPAPQPAT